MRKRHCIIINEKKEGRRNTRKRESVLSEAISLDVLNKVGQIFVVPPLHTNTKNLTMTLSKRYRVAIDFRSRDLFSILFFVLSLFNIYKYILNIYIYTLFYFALKLFIILITISFGSQRRCGVKAARK